jgi:hypothetical protein
MTFEKALEAMKQGKAVKRKNGNTKYIYIANEKKYKGLSEFGKDDISEDFFSMLFNDVWEICDLDYGCVLNVKTSVTDKDTENGINPDAFKNVGIEPGKAYNDLWFVKANQHTEECAKQIKEKLFEAYKLEPHKEETAMFTDLEITFKSGETITYKEGEWDDYSYDGKSVAVKKSCTWVGIYNFDNVFCVELKKREG